VATLKFILLWIGSQCKLERSWDVVTERGERVIVLAKAIKAIINLLCLGLHCAALCVTCYWWWWWRWRQPIKGDHESAMMSHRHHKLYETVPFWDDCRGRNVIRIRQAQCCWKLVPGRRQGQRQRSCVIHVVTVESARLNSRPEDEMCSASQKKFPWGFLAFSPKRLGIFRSNFMCLLNVPIYAILQIFIQLTVTLTKLFHITRDHPVQHTRKMFTIGRNACCIFRQFS